MDIQPSVYTSLGTQHSPANPNRQPHDAASRGEQRTLANRTLANSPEDKKSSTPVYPTPQAEEKAQQYLNAVRELKATEMHPKQTLASKTFLDIAHFESDVRLVDLYA